MTPDAGVVSRLSLQNQCELGRWVAELSAQDVAALAVKEHVAIDVIGIVDRDGGTRISMSEPGARRVVHVPDDVRWIRGVVGNPHGQSKHPLIERPIESLDAIR